VSERFAHVGPTRFSRQLLQGNIHRAYLIGSSAPSSSNAILDFDVPLSSFGACWPVCRFMKGTLLEAATVPLRFVDAEATEVMVVLLLTRPTVEIRAESIVAGRS